MSANMKTVDSALSAQGVDLPAEMLSRLAVEAYLDEVGHTAPMTSGERQRLTELLLAVEILLEKSVLTRRETEVFLEFQRRKAEALPATGKFALGNILVANGQITRQQLEQALHRQAHSGLRVGEELIRAGHVNRGQLEGGLVTQRKLAAYALAVSVGFVPLATLVSSAQAAQTNAAMQVSVKVVASAKMQTAYQATQLTISEADVARGYVEIPAAERFSVTTNSRIGYLVEFYPVGKLFESVLIDGLGAPVQLGADGGAIVQRGVVSPNMTHELSFRFTLSPDTLPGSYLWPLQSSVRAL